MGKRKIKAKRRNLKKRVHRNVQKVKGLTAEDLFMNPALLYSPQFKALPLEKQFQLTSQLKQIKMMKTQPMMMNGGSSGSSSAAHDLFNKLNASNNQLVHAQNDFNQMKTQLEATQQQLKEIQQLKSELKNKTADKALHDKNEGKIQDYTNQLHRFDVENNDKRINELQQQVKTKREEMKLDEIENQQRQIEELEAKHQALQKVRFTTPNREFKQRQMTEMYRVNKEMNLDEQSIYAQNIQVGKDNGNEELVDKSEIDLAELKKNFEIDVFDVDDDEVYEDYTFSPIMPKSPLSTIAENDLFIDELQKDNQKMVDVKNRRDENKSQLEEIKTEFSNFTPRTPVEAKVFEDKRTSAIMKVNKLKSFGVATTPEYMKTMTDKIQHAKTIEDLDDANKRIDYDISNAEEYRKQNEYVQNTKDVCMKILDQIAISSVVKSFDNFDSFRNSVIKKIKTANTKNEIQKIMFELNLLNLQPSSDTIANVAKWANESPTKEKPSIIVESPPHELPEELRNLNLTNAYQTIKLSDIESKGSTSVSNDVLIDGFSLRKLSEYFGVSSDKGKFILGLMGKLVSIAGKTTTTLLCSTVSGAPGFITAHPWATAAMIGLAASTENGAKATEKITQYAVDGAAILAKGTSKGTMNVVSGAAKSTVNKAKEFVGFTKDTANDIFNKLKKVKNVAVMGPNSPKEMTKQTTKNSVFNRVKDAFGFN